MCEDGGATVHRGSRSTILHRITDPSSWTDTTFWEERLERRGTMFVPGNDVPMTTEDRKQKSQSYSSCSQLSQIVTDTPPAALILCNKVSHAMLMAIW